ncbi:hypothetical protein AN642_00210 [Epulopiscium sp. SCG-B10WGA-EpuloA2]|nr:hypothetical protein AN642_00210 [Epulopiscium sp. SCG-B10WGA-EpuloA2]
MYTDHILMTILKDVPITLLYNPLLDLMTPDTIKNQIGLSRKKRKKKKKKKEKEDRQTEKKGKEQAVISIMKSVSADKQADENLHSGMRRER